MIPKSCQTFRTRSRAKVRWRELFTFASLKGFDVDLRVQPQGRRCGGVLGRPPPPIFYVASFRWASFKRTSCRSKLKRTLGGLAAQPAAFFLSFTRKS